MVYLEVNYNSDFPRQALFYVLILVALFMLIICLYLVHVCASCVSL